MQGSTAAAVLLTPGQDMCCGECKAGHLQLTVVPRLGTDSPPSVPPLLPGYLICRPDEPQGWLNIDFASEVRLERKLGEGGFGQVRG